MFVVVCQSFVITYCLSLSVVTRVYFSILLLEGPIGVSEINSFHMRV